MLTAYPHGGQLLGIPFVIALIVYSCVIIFSRSQKVRQIFRIINYTYILAMTGYVLTIVAIEKIKGDASWVYLNSFNPPELSRNEKIFDGYAIAGLIICILLIIGHLFKMKKLLTIIVTTFAIAAFAQVQQKQNPSDFIPKGYVLFEKINGDLNKDSVEDCVLIIKGTDAKKIVKDKNRGKLDRNRRGIIVLFNKNGHYELAAKNYACFSSENEDGGVYFAPELAIEVKKGNLLVSYGHGRYGYWRYTFRYHNSDFELIGYDASSDRGPVTESMTSINFLTHKKEVKENTNDTAAEGEEVYKVTRKNINPNSPIKLSKIKDFDDLDMNVY